MRIHIPRRATGALAMLALLACADATDPLDPQPERMTPDAPAACRT